MHRDVCEVVSRRHADKNQQVKGGRYPEGKLGGLNEGKEAGGWGGYRKSKRLEPSETAKGSAEECLREEVRAKQARAGFPEKEIKALFWEQELWKFNYCVMSFRHYYA